MYLIIVCDGMTGLTVYMCIYMFSCINGLDSCGMFFKVIRLGKGEGGNDQTKNNVSRSFTGLYEYNNLFMNMKCKLYVNISIIGVLDIFFKNREHVS